VVKLKGGLEGFGAEIIKDVLELLIRPSSSHFFQRTLWY
jgi:hypothetical protein